VGTFPVDIAHGVNRQAKGVDNFFFERIDFPNADQSATGWQDFGREIQNLSQGHVSHPQGYGQGHAVNISGGSVFMSVWASIHITPSVRSCCRQ
jgi:hypothetical protein